MGGAVCSTIRCFDPERAPTRRILIVGTSRAGKTCLLEKLGKPIGGPRLSLPGPGVAVETARLKGLQFVVLDLFENVQKRQQYRPFFRNTRGIILVVDVSSKESVDEASNIIKDVFDDDDLFGIPLLVVANKADLAELITETEVTARLRLNQLHGLDYSVHLCSVTNAEYDTSFYEGLNWLAEQVETNDELNAEREPFSL